MRMRIKVEKVAFHRNGVSGEPFHAVTFQHDREAYVAVVFAEPKHVAVLNRLAVGDGEVGDQFRGDYFEALLRREIERWEDDENARFLREEA